MENRKLREKERLFCENFVGCCDGAKAAAQAGYRKACHKKAGELLARADIKAEIVRLCELKRQTSREFARLGYERLAFGSISDAVSLLYLKNPTTQDLQEMDLYCVSEIKRLKDGLMEIKFFDRFKALQKLTEDANPEVCEKGKTPSVYDAIILGAQAIGGAEDGD